MSQGRVRAPMGMRKHGTSGRAGKSPRLRMHERLEAERAEANKPKRRRMYESVAEAFRKERQL